MNTNTIIETYKFRKHERKYISLFGKNNDNYLNKDIIIEKFTNLKSFRFHFVSKNFENEQINLKYFNNYQVYNNLINFLINDFVIKLNDVDFFKNYEKFKNRFINQHKQVKYFLPQTQITYPAYIINNDNFIDKTSARFCYRSVEKDNLNNKIGTHIEVPLMEIFSFFDNDILMTPGFIFKIESDLLNNSAVIDYNVNDYSNDGYMNINAHHGFTYFSNQYQINKFFDSIMISYDAKEFEFFEPNYINMIINSMQFLKSNELEKIYYDNSMWDATQSLAYADSGYKEIKINIEILPEYLFFNFYGLSLSGQIYSLDLDTLGTDYSKLVYSEYPDGFNEFTTNDNNSNRPFEIDFSYFELCFGEFSIFKYDSNIEKLNFFEYLSCVHKEYFSNNDIFTSAENSYNSFHFFVYKIVNNNFAISAKYKNKYILIKYKARTRNLYNLNNIHLNIFQNKRNFYYFYQNKFTEISPTEKLISFGNGRH